jgi:hypothetical protein
VVTGTRSPSNISARPDGKVMDSRWTATGDHANVAVARPNGTFARHSTTALPVLPEAHAQLCWKNPGRSLWCYLGQPISARRSVSAARRTINYFDEFVDQAWCSGKK